MSIYDSRPRLLFWLITILIYKPLVSPLERSIVVNYKDVREEEYVVRLDVMFL